MLITNSFGVIGNITYNMAFSLIPPVTSPYIITKKFGEPMSYGKHLGWDFAKLLDYDKPAYKNNIKNDWDVLYPCDGKIIEKRWSNSGGNILTIDAGNGFRVWLAHFERTYNAVGTIARHGDSAGKAGTTPGLPWSDYIHCHLQLYKNGVIVDPAPYFNLNEPVMNLQNSIVRDINTGGFYFFKGTQAYAMARQPLSARTVGFASLTLQQVWKERDFEHIYELTTEEIMKYAIVWKFFPEDIEYTMSYKD